MVLPAVLLLGIGFLTKDPDWWHSQMMFGQMAVTVWVVIEIFKRIGWIPASAFLYFSVYFIWSQFSLTQFSMKGVDFQSFYESEVSKSFTFLLLASIPFVFSKREDLSKWLMGFQVFAIVNAIAMGFNWFAGPGMSLEVAGHHAATGFIGMDSVDGTFECLVLPTLIFSNRLDEIDKHLAAGLILVAVFLAHSSTCFGLLCLEVLLFAFLKMEKTAKNIGLLTLAGMFSLPFGFLYLGKYLLEPNGRQMVLSRAIHIFKTVGSYIFGVGPATFSVIMPVVQGTKNPYFIWLHDEPLQVLWEQGLVGLALLAATYFAGLYKQRKSTVMVVLLCAAGFQSFIQPCFRYFIFAMFMAFICRLSFEDDVRLLL